MRGVNFKKIVQLQDVKITLAAEDWQLYDIDGSQQAAKELNDTLTAALSAPNATPGNVQRAMFKTMDKLANFGAMDGEPYWVLDQILNDVFGHDSEYDPIGGGGGSGRSDLPAGSRGED